MSPFICSHLLAFFFILFLRLLEAFFPILLCQVNGRVLVWVFQRNRISREGVCVWGGGDVCGTGSWMREAELSHDLLDPGDPGKLRG